MYTAETSGLQGQWPNLFKAKAKIMCPRAVLKVDDSPRAPHPCFFLAFLTTWNVRLSGYTTLCLNKTSDLRLAVTFDTRERILIFFGRNVTNKVSSQNTLYYATSNNLCFCTVWQNGKNENCVFHSALPEFNQSLLDFFQSFWLTTHTHAAPWLPKSGNQCIQLGAVSGHGSGETKSRVLRQLDCVARRVHQCTVFWISWCNVR